MSTVSSNQQYQDPAWLSDFLQKHADEEIKVTQGPGGMTISVAGESVFIGPSQMGVLGSFKGTLVTTSMSVNASDPFLMLPSTVSFNLTPTWINYFVNFITPPPVTDDSDPFGFDVGGGDRLHSGLQMPVPSDLGSTEKSKVLEALTKFTKLNENPGLTGKQREDFGHVLDNIAEQVANSNKNGPIKELGSGDAQEIAEYLSNLIPGNSRLSSDDKEVFQSTLYDAAWTITANEYTAGLQSKDSKTVLSALMSFTGIDKDPAFDGNEALRSTLLGKLTDLANAMAKQNSTGATDPALLSFDAKTIGTYLLSQIDLSSLSKADQVLFQNFMSTAALAIGSLNAASGQPLPKSALMLDMESTDPAVVQAALKSMIGAGMTDAEIAALDLAALASAIATKNGSPDGSGLNIADADTLKAVLLALAGSGSDALTKAIGLIATAFAAENTRYFTILSKSTDANVVFDALRVLSNIDHNPNLTPAERAAALDYLKLMATALAFMSQIRAKVSMLEAELRKQTSEGKLSTIRDQTAAALNTHKTGVEKIQKDLQSTLDALALQALMKILGPIIMVIIAIIMAIITIFSFGTAAPVAAAIMVAVIVVMCVLAIADQAANIFEKAAKGMGAKSDTAVKGISAAIQAVIMAIATVVTFGAASFMFVAMRIAQTAVQAVQMALKEVTTKLISEGLMKQFIMFFIGQIMSILMSSGILTDGLTKMFKAMGMSDKDAEIAAMVTAMLMMLIMLIVSIASMPGQALKTGADAAGKGAQAGAKAADTVIDDQAQQATQAAARSAAQAAQGATRTVVEDVSESVMVKVVQQLQKILSKMQELAKEPETYLKIAQALAMLMQVASGLANATNEFKQADLKTAQASLEKANAETQALVEFLRQILPTFDVTQQDIDNDAKDFNRMINDLFNLFANMVSSASAITTETAQTA